MTKRHHRLGVRRLDPASATVAFAAPPPATSPACGRSCRRTPPSSAACGCATPSASAAGRITGDGRGRPGTEDRAKVAAAPERRAPMQELAAPRDGGKGVGMVLHEVNHVAA